MAEEPVKQFKLEEVAKHNGKEDRRTWIIIKDSVYDVTDYLEDHPGGSELIEEWAGKDGTKDFNDFGHSGDAKKKLKQFKIGEVVEEERKKKSKKTEAKTNGQTQSNTKDSPEVVIRRSCISIITCGLMG